MCCVFFLRPTDREADKYQDQVDTSNDEGHHTVIDICPLEREFLTQTNTTRSKSTYPLTSFIDWAWRENDFSTAHQRVGVVRSVHLLRERSTIHHEYAIFSFDTPNPGVSGTPHRQSWVRIERAAKLRARWFNPRSDSFGPILGGAQLRESISFSTDFSALRRAPDDELASIHISQPTTTTPTLLLKQRSMLLHEFAFQLREASARSDRYRLFTVNCRWFGRRNLLSSAEWFTAASIPITVTWLDQPVELSVLRTKLEKERFGGRQLGGRKGAHIRARLLADLAWHLVCTQEPARALPLCREGILLLEAQTEPPTDRHLYLVSGLENTLAIGLRFLKRLPEALEAHRRACDISSRIRPGYEKLYHVTHNALANTLQMAGQIDEACVIHKDLVRSRRELYTVHGTSDPDYGEHLAQALWSYAGDLASLPGPPPLSRLEERLQTIEESVSVYRSLSQLRPDLYRNGLSNSLSDNALALATMGRVEEAVMICQEAFELRRPLVDSDPGSSRPKYAGGLNHLARYLARLGKWEEACDAGVEAIPHFRILIESDQETGATVWTPALAGFLHFLGHCFLYADRLVEAFERWEEARVLYLSLPDGACGDAPTELAATMIDILGQLYVIAPDLADDLERLQLERTQS